MKGYFYCMGQHFEEGIKVVPSNPASWNRLGPPDATDIAWSYQPIQMAEYVIFIADDGEVWEIKNRFGTRSQIHRIDPAGWRPR